MLLNISSTKSITKEPNLKPMNIQMVGYEVVEKRADKGGNSGRIYVPKSWIGKLIRAVRIEK